MRFHERDSHLEHARLYSAPGETVRVREHFDKAKGMVDETGYHRRDTGPKELEAGL